MEVIFNVSENVLIAHIRGEVDHHSAAPLRQTIDKSMKAFDCHDLILDFSGVSFMDSAGIGVALGRYRKLAKTSGTVVIAGCSEYITRLLDMAGVFSLMQKADDPGSALEMLRGREQMTMEV